MMRRITLLLLLLLLLPAPALATNLTLEQCLTIALKENLNLQADEEQRTAQEANETAALRQMLPAVSVASSRVDILHQSEMGSVGSSHGSGEQEYYYTTVTLTQPLYRGGALMADWQRAGAAREEAEHELRTNRLTLILEVKSTWYTLLEASALLAEARDSRQRLQTHAKNARAYYAEGRYWKNEVLQAEVELARGEQEVIQAEHRLALSGARLNHLLRRPLHTPVAVSGQLAVIPLTWQLDDAVALARQQRPELSKAALVVRQGELNETITAAGLKPQVDLELEWQGEAPDLHYRDTGSETQALVTLSWDVWEWGKTLEELKAARANTRKSRLRQGEAEERVTLEVREAFLEAEQTRQRITLLEGALIRAEENIRVNQLRYEEQIGTATDVLNALALLTRTRRDLITAQSGYLLALAKLERAVGGEAGAP